MEIRKYEIMVNTSCVGISTRCIQGVVLLLCRYRLQHVTDVFKGAVRDNYVVSTLVHSWYILKEV